MKRSELEHILRAAATIAGDFDVLVLGSQSILGSFTEHELPEKAHASIEADVTFFDDYENDKSDLVDMHLGEDSQFHATFGYYAQGVNVEVATLPVGWQGRVVVLSSDETNGASGHCLEPHDLVFAIAAIRRWKRLASRALELLWRGVDRSPYPPTMPKRLPPRTPGPASTTDIGMSNWMVPMELHRDAVGFYADAGRAEKSGDRDERDRHARAAIVAAFAGLEAQLNMTAAGHAEAHQEAIEPVVLDVLRERETVIDDRGRIIQRRRLMSLPTRISFLAAFISGEELDRSGQMWQDLVRAIELRNRCVHRNSPSRSKPRSLKLHT